MDPAGEERAAWTEKAARTRVHQRAGAGQLGGGCCPAGGSARGSVMNERGCDGGWGGGKEKEGILYSRN